MRLADIQLRDAARRGDAIACVAMAERLFAGSDGLSQNYTLGIAYLQPELHKKTSSAVLLIGNRVPLEVVQTQQLVPVLRAAVDLGSQTAMLKLGILLSLRVESRDEGARLIHESGFNTGLDAVYQFTEAESAASFLRDLPPSIVAPQELALMETRAALDKREVEQACYLIGLAARLGELTPALAGLISSAAKIASRSDESFALPASLVERALQICAAAGESEAQYGLGCAYAGLPYGRLAPTQLVANRSFEKGTALLLRAADAGKSEAWLHLSEAVAGRRSSLSSKGVARYFLEKAAHAGVLNAQTRLGAALLKEATCLTAAEEGVTWLATAAASSCSEAAKLLQTLVLPIPELPPDYEKTLLQRIAAMDAELGVRVSLARSLHLTRHEALTFVAKRDFRGWGMRIPGAAYENPKGRVAPAVLPEMKFELQRAEAFFGASNSLKDALLVQRSRAQRRIFAELSISEDLVFASGIGRSLSHYGYGRHWAYRTTPVLESLLASA